MQKNNTFKSLTGLENNPEEFSHIIAIKRATTKRVGYPVNYSLMASAGHSSTHAPHSVHSSALITAISLTIVMHSAGHASTHSSQPVHSLASILGTAILSSEKVNY
jgi:hypothetical protein